MTTVLALGLDPTFVELPPSPSLTPDLVRAFIESQLERLRASGYEVVSCLVDLGQTAEAVTEQCLASHRFDCVVFGAALRAPERLLLFEKLLNLVHLHASGAKLCFNTNPADTTEAVQRWV
ncbi:MAG: hypothetical protein DME65_03885 [Verrucomicrobia bacterium]|nr:MAG: hypothetical protein DME65_03885 [Verrucomicrobiota bacterium]